MTAAPAAGGVVERLRTGTRAEHDAIEATLGWEARASDRDRYRDWLQRLYGFHRLWEPAIASALADPIFFDPRRKLALLADDLARLEIAGASLDRLPVPSTPFRFVSAAEALGSMYVLEGSTLGGRIIARQVIAGIGHVPRYHDAYGSDTGLMWRRFRIHLQSAIPPEQEDAALAAASATFSRLRRWLARPDDLQAAGPGGERRRAAGR